MSRAAVALLASSLLASSPAQAAEDGAYGRLGGDLALSIELGVAESFPGESLAVRPSVQYLCSMGVYAQYQDSFDRGGQPVARSLVGGIELRPLFLARFFQDQERGPAIVDLLIDSAHLALGVYAADRLSADAQTRPSGWDSGLELGAGFELPLLPRIDGPFVGFRGALRWSLDRRWAAVTGADADGALMLTLGVHHLLTTGLLDDGD